MWDTTLKRISPPSSLGTLRGASALWGVLREELLNFRRKIDLRTAHDSYEHWRESDHDDLVLATALAAWWIAYRNRRGVAMRVYRKPVGF